MPPIKSARTRRLPEETSSSRSTWSDRSEFSMSNGDGMAASAYEREITGLLVIDPYNDFISEGGKLWGRVKAIAEANHCVPNMRRVLPAARDAGLRVFFVPHRRYRPGDYDTWKY